MPILLVLREPELHAARATRVRHFGGGIIACPRGAMTESFEEFLRERREHAERTRRLLVGVLGIACVALAVSNVVLALRLTAVRARATAEAPSASIPSRAEGLPLPGTLPMTIEPATERAEARPAAPPSEEPAGHAAAPTTKPPDARDGVAAASALPPRALVASVPARSVPARPRAAAPEPAPAPATPEAFTAAWMLTTYGRAEAEARARAALEFYDAQSADGRYWQRVLTEIATAR